MKRKTFRTGMIFAGLLIFAMSASAWQGHYGKKGKHPKGMRESGSPMVALLKLDLSDKQIEQMIDLHAAHMKEQLPLHRKKMAVGNELLVLNQSDSPDPDKLHSLMQKMAGIKADMQINAAKARTAAKTMLTDEQKVKLGDNPLPLFCGPGGWGQGRGPGDGAGMYKKGKKPGWWMNTDPPEKE